MEQAQIYLSGDSSGTGWVAVSPSLLGPDGAPCPIGDGHPSEYRAFTDSLWQALAAVERTGYRGVVVVWGVGARIWARAHTGERAYYGNLAWHARRAG